MTNKIDYQYYKGFNENATTDNVKVEFFKKELTFAADMLKFINNTKNEKFDEITQNFKTYLEKESYKGQDVSIKSIFGDLHQQIPVLFENENLPQLIFRVLIKYTRINIDYNWEQSSDLPELRNIDVYKAGFMITYYFLHAMVKILGRQEGIQLYKDFIDHYAQQLSKQEQGTRLASQTKNSFIEGWRENKGWFDLAIYEYDKEMVLIKFDRCAAHESMKDVEDKELANYVVCYPGAIFTANREKYLRKKNIKTLFERDYCDELWWSTNSHQEPKTPSEEFMAKLIEK